MSRRAAGNGGPAPQGGLLHHVAATLRSVLQRKEGRFESAIEPEQPVELVPEEPEHVHHSRFTVEELDEFIADSFRRGVADLHAAENQDATAKEDRPRRRKRRTPAARSSQPKAFGGDLYPTEAHARDPDAHYVKVSTWAQTKSKSN